MELSDHFIINLALVLWPLLALFFILFLGQFKVRLQEFKDSQSFLLIFLGKKVNYFHLGLYLSFSCWLVSLLKDINIFAAISQGHQYFLQQFHYSSL